MKTASRIDPNARFSMLWLVSWIVWKIPARRALKMAMFSHTEAGSSLDMLAAAEETGRPDLRRKFFRHALDEHRHAGYFAARAMALLKDKHAATLLRDTTFMTEYGILGADSLYRKLGEIEFLAFVWLHEKRGAEQFVIYARLLRNDPQSVSMFESIGKDEQFHISYTRRELDRLIQGGLHLEVRAAIHNVQVRRVTNALLRWSRSIGEVFASIWLFVLFFIVLFPFSIAARCFEKPPSGFVSTGSAGTRARAEAGLQG